MSGGAFEQVEDYKLRALRRAAAQLREIRKQYERFRAGTGDRYQYGEALNEARAVIDELNRVGE